MTVTDHEKLHQALEAACREAAELKARGIQAKRRKDGLPDEEEDAEEEL